MLFYRWKGAGVMIRLKEHRPFEILLIEDNPGDIRLIQEIMKDSPIPKNWTVLRDGDSVLRFLQSLGLPDYTGSKLELILMDWNVPGRSGGELLQQIKSVEELRCIPVIVFSSSEAPEDIRKAYDAQAACFLTKPQDLDRYTEVIRAIESFWLTTAQLPTR
jgi:two-component system, chemotaxis family, response regulator Rcp1